MDNPLTKVGVIELANEIIEDTVQCDQLSEFMLKRKLKNENNVGNSWYKGFINCHSEFLKRSKCKIRDTNRINWYTYKNFSNMYEGIKNSMVKAGVAIATPEERMYDIFENRALTKDGMVGCPIKFQLKKPGNVFFVMWTGCNTNQKVDGHIGGEIFVLPTGSSDTGVKGACTDTHVSVLCFNNANGDALMCVIILNSNFC
jgi:hypothetical protein